MRPTGCLSCRVPARVPAHALARICHALPAARTCPSCPAYCTLHAPWSAYLSLMSKGGGHVQFSAAAFSVLRATEQCRAARDAEEPPQCHGQDKTAQDGRARAQDQETCSLAPSQVAELICAPIAASSKRLCARITCLACTHASHAWSARGDRDLRVISRVTHFHTPIRQSQGRKGAQELDPHRFGGQAHQGR